MEQSFEQWMKQITDRLDIIIKLLHANTPKQNLCQHLALQDEMPQNQWTTYNQSGELKSFKIVVCLGCGIRFTEEVK